MPQIPQPTACVYARTPLWRAGSTSGPATSRLHVCAAQPPGPAPGPAPGGAGDPTGTPRPPRAENAPPLAFADDRAGQYAEALNECIAELALVASGSKRSDPSSDMRLWGKFMEARSTLIAAASEETRGALESAIPATHEDLLLGGSVHVAVGAKNNAAIVTGRQSLLSSDLKALAEAQEALKEAALSDPVHQAEVKREQEKGAKKSRIDYSAIKQTADELGASRRNRLEKLRDLAGASERLAERLEEFSTSVLPMSGSAESGVQTKAAKLREFSDQLTTQYEADNRTSRIEVARAATEARKSGSIWAQTADLLFRPIAYFSSKGAEEDPTAYIDAHGTFEVSDLPPAPRPAAQPAKPSGGGGRVPDPATTANPSGPERPVAEPTKASPEKKDGRVEIPASESEKEMINELAKDLNQRIADAGEAAFRGKKGNVSAAFVEARAKFIEAAGAGNAALKSELEALIPGTTRELLLSRSARVDLKTGTPTVSVAPALLEEALKRHAEKKDALERASNADPVHQWNVARDAGVAPGVAAGVAAGVRPTPAPKEADARVSALNDYTYSLGEVKDRLDSFVNADTSADAGVRWTLDDIAASYTRLQNQHDVESKSFETTRNEAAAKHGWKIDAANPGSYPDKHETVDLGIEPRAPAPGGAAPAAPAAPVAPAAPAAPAPAATAYARFESGLGAVGSAASGLAAGIAGSVVGAASGVTDTVVGAVAPTEERIIARDVRASGAGTVAQKAVLDVLSALKLDTPPEERLRILDQAREVALANKIALREYWRGGVALAPWVDPKQAAATEARLRSAPVRASMEVGLRVLVIGVYKGLSTERGVVAVHAHGAVASVGATQDPGFWRALEAKISRAYAPMVVAPLAAVVVADAVVDAGAALAARMLDETGVCVVHLAAHCSAAPPDSEMHALGAFAAGAPPQAYVLSARGPKRKIRYPLYREGPIDRNARDATRDLFAARVKGASNWAKALETVVEFIASKGI